MSIILCIENPNKELTTEEWVKFGRYSNKGFRFDEMYSPDDDYILELPYGVYYPVEFYEGFFRSVLEINREFNFCKITTRMWSSACRTYVYNDETLYQWLVVNKFDLNAKSSG